ncbi:hypothetical protein Mal4_35450 [Maioricimonas rarisocia]|uniref:Uncharacterized protein n=1 Tax=Maioricimonas rarisocia TaxID=2528026 RepID=A0A517Z9P3_9PLAN|nr:hypothetical protein [Maioricimonas rarisocia]QDU39208.1 hypothetical protein Mal4_35450 [Maioricimonas rarisocia]
MVGVEEPVTAEEAARMARKALEQSESHDDDLALAYRQAALALQAAEAFPGNDECLALADAARGRLRALERQAVSPVELQQSGDAGEKPIIESP